MTLDELGLIPTLERYFDYMRQHNGTEVSLQVSGPSDMRLPAAVEVGVFRAVQEAGTTAWRHAQASRIEVTFRFSEDVLEATVTDDGIGFDVPMVLSELKQRASFGLKGMQERMELIQGEISVDSVVDKGTTIRLRVPIRVNQG